MDFIVKLPPSADPVTRESYDGIMVVTDRFTKRHTGSVFSGQNTVGVTIDQLLSKERAQ